MTCLSRMPWNWQMQQDQIQINVPLFRFRGGAAEPVSGVHTLYILCAPSRRKPASSAGVQGYRDEGERSVMFHMTGCFLSLIRIEHLVVVVFMFTQDV